MSKSIAPLDTTSKSLAALSNPLDTVAKFVRVMEKTRVTHGQFMLPINDRVARRNLATFLKAGCPDIMNVKIQTLGASRTSYEFAQTILGQDFITPKEIVAARPGIVYTQAQLEQFERTLPSSEELEWCRDNGMMLVAGPPKSMSLLDIRRLKIDFFNTKQEAGWYLKRAEKFARNDGVEPVWMALKKEPIAGSFDKMGLEQNKLVALPMTVPNVAETIWGITTYMAVRSVHLLPSFYVRTSSLDSDGDRVYVGYFDSGGLSVGCFWDDYRGSDLGVPASRKFLPAQIC